MAMTSPWLRLWSDMPNDPKWRTIARVAKQSIPCVISVFLHVLVCASNATERGRTHDVCSEDIASALDLECEQVDAILAAMQGRVLDGDMVSGWHRRQPNREDDGAARSKAWREAKKQQKDAEKSNQNAIEQPTNATKRNRTKPNANATQEEIREEYINTQSIDGFVSFYQAYPKKVARPEAAKAFKAQKVNGEIRVILADIQNRISSGEWVNSKEKRKYIPNPATYLNQRRWEDEAPTSNQVAGAI